MEYDLLRPWLSLDDWQKTYIETEENCFLLCGRQSGKSAAMSIKFGKRAAERPKQCILIIALTEKQAYNLFFRTLSYLLAVYPKMIARGRLKPTKHEINLTNGSKIMCYAAGMTGEGLVGYTLTNLVIDEAASMNREIFVLLSPSLSVTGGHMDLSSTPKGKEGYFYECSRSNDFKKFYVSAEDCPRHKKDFLEAEKNRMSRLEYAQEYLAVFLDELKRLFSDELIRQCCILKRKEYIVPDRDYFMGMDVARMGEDESAFEIIERIDRDNLHQVENIITTKTRLTDTAEKVIELQKQWQLKKVGIDAIGVGAGVFDYLLKEDSIKNKIVPLNASTRSLNRDDSKKGRLLKEDMYMSFLMMLEQNKLKLLDDDDLIASLKSIQYEYIIKKNQKSQFRIFGSYSHCVEGLVRSCWLAREKSLNLWAA